MAKIEVDEAEFNQMVALRGVAAKIVANPAARRQLEAAHKLVDPNAATPLLDQEAQQNAPIKEMEKKLTTTLNIPKSALYKQVLPTPAAIKALTWEKDGTTHQLSPEQVKRVENEWVTYTPGGLVVAPEGDSRPAVARDFSRPAASQRHS